jgi:hypothetical protein
MDRRTSFGVLLYACALLLACGRTLSPDDDRASVEDADGGVEGAGSSGSGAGRDGDGDGDVGADGSSTGSGAGRAGSSADPSTAGQSGTPPPIGGTGSSMEPSTGAAGSSAQPPPIDNGRPGFEEPADPDGLGAAGVLNPQRCATDEPFVLSIDPGGTSGTVSGWLESAPTVIFDTAGLPRFGNGFNSQGSDALMLWWSIASLGPPGVDDPSEDSLYVYTLNEQTELVALTAQSAAEIGDAKQLTYTSFENGLIPVGPIKIMEITVLHHIPTDRYLAMQVLDVFGADDPLRRSECAAIEARWMMAPQGTGDFSEFE